MTRSGHLSSNSVVCADVCCERREEVRPEPLSSRVVSLGRAALLRVF